MFIIATVHINRRAFSGSKTRGSHQAFKYQVPLFIALTFITFCLIPDLVLVIDDTYWSVWIRVTYYINYICDPMIYVVYTKRICMGPPKKRNKDNDEDSARGNDSQTETNSQAETALLQITKIGARLSANSLYSLAD